MPPSESVQLLTASARAFSGPVSIVKLVGSVAAVPVAGFASKAASRKALVMPCVLVALAPMLVIDVVNGASAQAAATVVSSLM